MRKHYKPITEPRPPVPLRFERGNRVKPTLKGRSLLLNKPGLVISCGVHTVEVQMDGEKHPDYYAGDLWEAE